MGFSFFGSENKSTYANALSSVRLDPSSTTRYYAKDEFGNAFVQTHQDRLDRAWGIGPDNDIIDDDNVRERTYLENSYLNDNATHNAESASETPSGDTFELLDTGNGEDEDVLDTPEIFTGIAEAEEVGASSTPLGIAALINQQVGQGLNQALTASMQNTQSQDYIQNIQQHGVNVQLNADLIKSAEQQTIDAKTAGGNLASLFGPLGTIIGRAAAGTVQQNSNFLNTDASFSGWVNPSDTGIANSASTADPSGQSDMIQSF